MLSGELCYLTLTYLDNTFSVWQLLFRLLTPDILRYVKTCRVTEGLPCQNSRSASPFFPVSFPFGPILPVLALPHFNQIFFGDLEVEIREANGSIRRYTQPTAVLPILQRPRRLRYNLALGKYHSTSICNNRVAGPQFIQTSVDIGLPSECTL